MRDSMPQQSVPSEDLWEGSRGRRDRREGRGGVGGREGDTIWARDGVYGRTRRGTSKEDIGREGGGTVWGKDIRNFIRGDGLVCKGGRRTLGGR